MNVSATKQIALSYLNRHLDTPVEDLYLQEQTDTRWVYWSKASTDRVNEFYEVEIDTEAGTIMWKIVKGVQSLDAMLKEALTPLNILRGEYPHRDMFQFRGNNQIWVCWLKLNNDEGENCYLIKPVGPDGELGEGKEVPNTLVRLAGVWHKS